jgi:NTP pyrophosphatase (non-canonical NTP hydrolase)
VADVADELADCLIYVCAIANRYRVDLEAAFRAKEAKNSEREWTVTP